jgi:hypothetical protein
MQPHNNPHWKAKRQERDIERILQGKQVSNSDFHVTRAPNIFVLMLKMLFTNKHTIPRRAVLSALLAGSVVDLWHRLLRREPKPEPASSEIDPDTEEFPF